MSEKIKKRIRNAAEILIYPVILFIILNFIIGVAVIRSDSMQPAIDPGDIVIINRLAYIGDFKPQRGDIAIFKSNELNKNLGKRVIGLPGDTIEFKNNKVYINGTILDESAYISEDVRSVANDTYSVPDNCYFMLGDNRESSNDSRFWEHPYINEKDIIGKYLIKLW